jgi:hypothetical protein
MEKMMKNVKLLLLVSAIACNFAYAKNTKKSASRTPANACDSAADICNVGDAPAQVRIIRDYIAGRSINIEKIKNEVMPAIRMIDRAWPTLLDSDNADTKKTVKHLTCQLFFRGGGITSLLPDKFDPEHHHFFLEYNAIEKRLAKLVANETGFGTDVLNFSYHCHE